MDTEVLVSEKLEDGRRLLQELARQEFAVTIAFWAKRSEESSWRMYIATPTITEGAYLAPAFASVYGAIDQINDCHVQPVDITLLSSNDPIAKDAVRLRSRNSRGELTVLHNRTLAQWTIAEIIIYAEPQPMPVREYEGSWQVLVSEADDNWLNCDSELDARAISMSPVLKYEALQELKSDADFADELDKSADALARYRMGFGARQLKRRADEIRKQLGAVSP